MHKKLSSLNRENRVPLSEAVIEKESNAGAADDGARHCDAARERDPTLTPLLCRCTGTARCGGADQEDGDLKGRPLSAAERRLPRQPGNVSLWQPAATGL